jgi:glycosyltransferase involved in cell wall biosynthesis
VRSLDRGTLRSGWLKEAVRPYYLRWLYFPLRPGQRPAAFADCWRFPFQKIVNGSTRLPASPSNLPDLLFYPMTDWHTRTQRTQHLVRAFAGLGFRSIYINPHLGRQFETSPLFDPVHRLAQLEDRIFELHVRLPREPVFHDRLLYPAEEDIIASAIHSVLPRGATVIQILSFPLWLGVARRFRSELAFPIAYDCHDLLSGFENVARELIAAETDLLAEADLVLFSSQGLADRYGKSVHRSLLVRNGVSAAAFDDAAVSSASPPAVGYVGALESWLDTASIREAALRNPGCRFVLAGRVEHAPIRRLAALPNVEFAGEIPYHQVPEFLTGLRVGLIPFSVTPLTLMTNPIKLYEYFSRGLPVVAAPLPEVAAMGDLVYLAGNPVEFASQVTRALEEDAPSRRARRKEIAARESWTSRARAISLQFHALMACRQVPCSKR